MNVNTGESEHTIEVGQAHVREVLRIVDFGGRREDLGAEIISIAERPESQGGHTLGHTLPLTEAGHTLGHTLPQRDGSSLQLAA